MVQRTNQRKSVSRLKREVKKVFEENLREVIPKRYPYYVQVLPGWLEDEVRVCVISNYFRRFDSRYERRDILWNFAQRHLSPDDYVHISIIGGYPIEEALDYPFLDHSQWATDGQPNQDKNKRRTPMRPSARKKRGQRSAALRS